MSEIDIHNYQALLAQERAHLRRRPISERNKQLILDFERSCVLSKAIGVPRRIRIVNILGKWAVRLGKNLDEITTEELKQAVIAHEDRQDLSVETKRTEKIILRLFYKWLAYGDEAHRRKEYPPIVAWMSIHIPTNQLPRIERDDILTFAEVRALTDAARTPRDKAFLSVLYETGCRIAEIGNRTLKDVTALPEGFRIHLSGKTGARDRLLLESAAHLAAWLNDHPLRNDRDAPLWTMGPDHRPCTYRALAQVVTRTAQRAGITKRVHAHLFRHTRATHLLLKGEMNEAQVKIYFGWAPDSKMLSRYSHLVNEDVDDTYRRMHGIDTARREDAPPKMEKCHTCGTICRPGDLFCWRCARPLHIKTAHALEELRDREDEKMDTLLDDQDVRALVKQKYAQIDALQRLIEEPPPTSLPTRPFERAVPRREAPRTAEPS